MALSLWCVFFACPNSATYMALGDPLYETMQMAGELLQSQCFINNRGGWTKAPNSPVHMGLSDKGGNMVGVQAKGKPLH